MSKVDCVAAVPKLEFETATEKIAAIWSFSRRLVVRDVLTISVPADLLLLRFLHAVEQRLHSLRVVRISFHQVANVESVRLTLLGIAALKKVPLSVSLSPVVCFYVEVVFPLWHFVYFVQITRLESRFKLQRWVTCCQLVVRLQSLIITVEPFGTGFWWVLLLQLTVFDWLVGHRRLFLQGLCYNLYCLRLI